MSRKNYIVRGLFRNEKLLLLGAEQTMSFNCQWLNCYSPKPLEDLDGMWDQPRSPLPKIVFIGGLLGATGGFGMQYYAMAINYSHNVGGRPLFSWPLYLPITFELMVLAAAATGFFGLFLILGLPRLHQPILESPLSKRICDDEYLIEACLADRTGAEHLAKQLKDTGALKTEIINGGPDA